MKAPKYLLTPADDIVELLHDAEPEATYKHRDNTIITVIKTKIDDGMSNYRTFNRR